MTISNLFSIDEGDKVFDAQTAGHIRGARCPNEGRVHDASASDSWWSAPVSFLLRPTQ